MFRESKCTRFKKLRLLADDVAIGEADAAFLVEHAASCEDCSLLSAELDASANALKGAGYAYSGASNFAVRVSHALTRERIRRQLNDWRPAIAGALTAAVALAAIIQMLTAEPGYASPEGTAAMPRTGASPSSEIRIFDLDRTVTDI
jgi:hypothetical protein